MLAVIVDGDDVGMAESGRCASLVLEAPPYVGLSVECRVEQLDRDRTVQPGVPAVADLRHPTATEDATKLVAAGKQFAAIHGNTVAPLRCRQTSLDEAVDLHATSTLSPCKATSWRPCSSHGKEQNSRSAGEARRRFGA